MRINVFLLLLLSIIAISVAERFVKVEGTSGEFSDIVVDNEGKWYIIKDKTLYYSSDKGVTLNKIKLPSKKLVYPGIGVDKSGNVYVQDEKLTVYRVTPTTDETFTFKEMELPYGKEKLLGRPFFIRDNIVHFVTKSSLSKTKWDNIEEITEPPYSRTEMTQLVPYNYTHQYLDVVEGLFYSGGGPRHWIYELSSYFAKPICQTNSFVKRMNSACDHIYYAVNGEKKISVILARDPTYVTTIDGIDASNINRENDFVISLPDNNHKTYIYMNIEDTGTLYELNEKIVNGKNITEVASTHKINKVRLNCGTVYDDEIYFGTSDGVYVLKRSVLSPVIRFG